MKKINLLFQQVLNSVLVLLFFISNIVHAQISKDPFALKSKDFEIIKGDSLIVNICFENTSENDTIIIDLNFLERFMILSDANGFIYSGVKPHEVETSEVNYKCRANEFLNNPDYIVMAPGNTYEMEYNFSKFHTLEYNKVRRKQGDKSKYLFFVELRIPQYYKGICNKIVTGNYTTEDYYYYSIDDTLE